MSDAHFVKRNVTNLFQVNYFLDRHCKFPISSDTKTCLEPLRSVPFFEFKCHFDIILSWFSCTFKRARSVPSIAEDIVATREGILCSDSGLVFCTQIRNMRKAYSADLSLRQIAILLICSSSTQGLTGSQLALELNLTPSVVARAVARMVSCALLVRVIERDRGGLDLIFASSRGRDFARKAALETPI